MPKKITILGSTGSIGCNTVKLLQESPASYQVEALTAHSNVTLLASQAIALNARRAVIAKPELYSELKNLLSGTEIEVAAGIESLEEAASLPSDFVMAAMVGAVGLKPTLAAIRRGAVIGLANKECLVSAGPLMMEELRNCDATLIPVDSEHNAIFQVFDTLQVDKVEKIILTASGGPFRTWNYQAMADVTPEQAIKHPNWQMGMKISVDSATMMNKGLELIEAYYLFPVGANQIEVLIHPESVVHSMVAYKDGSVLAQMGTPDMRTPIAVALAWPGRMEVSVPRLNLAEIGRLTFEPVDTQKFPALQFAREALAAGGSMPAVLNAANEVAVAAFIQGRIGFLDIANIVDATLHALPNTEITSIDAVIAVDDEARRKAETFVGTMGFTSQRLVKTA